LEEAHITILAVHPCYRRQGLGQALLIALLTTAFERGLNGYAQFEPPTLLLCLYIINLASKQLGDGGIIIKTRVKMLSFSGVVISNILNFNKI
jgi:GNAT superfamily N-acetyltransferase